MRLNIQRYRVIMTEKGILDETVRKSIGMCNTTFSQLVNGDLGGVSCEVMEGIAEVLGCTVRDISLSDLDEGENMIDWQKDAKRATLTFSQPRMISRIKELAGKRPNDVHIVSDSNKVLYAYVPAAWIKINPPRELSEEEKVVRAERIRETRKNTSQH